MPKRRPTAHDVTTEKAVKHLFPNEAREAAQITTRAGECAPDAEQPGEGRVRSRPRAKEVALRRLREASDEELAVFEDTLRQDALATGATEQELRVAQSGHPGHA
jgi:hypothetical protein